MDTNIYAMVKKNKKYNIKNIKFVHSANIHKFIKNIDYVINLLPLTEETSKFININFFKKMKKSSYFISLGRGQTVEEKDLIFALENNLILGAGIDVFENEPLSMNSKLLKLKNVVLTPHIGNINQKYWKYEIDLFLNNLNRFFKKRKLKNIVKI